MKNTNRKGNKYAVKECKHDLERKPNLYTFAVVGKSPTYVLHSSYNNRHALRACTSKPTIMARSKSFFGLRRGSTKELTFSTYRGQQVTKSRVTNVANPQTMGQMEQRLRLVQVANAAAKLKGLIDHSFEGVTYGQTSIGKFRAMNLSSGALYPRSWVPKGVGDCGVADFIVSKGTLPEINSVFDATDAKSGANASIKQAVAIDSSRETFLDWMDKNGFKEGDQLTFLAGFQNGTSVESNGRDVYFHLFAISRFEFRFDQDGEMILDEDNLNNGWLVNQLNPSETLASGMVLSNELFSLQVSSANTPAVRTLINFKGAGYAEKIGYMFDMFGVIHSRLENNVWRRSFCQLAVKESEGYWNSYEQAVGSYVKKIKSDKYLNMGAQKTGILGNQ